jgi:hypothetical protein
MSWPALRESELLGLKWEDVNEGAGTLAVRRTLSETPTGYKFERPKNGKGRSVKLSGGRRSPQEPPCAPARREAQGRFSTYCSPQPQAQP